ncbi:hypothetical protein SUGI_0560990 [Cryptomeria japonica]|nr:hypothetical protein SUGI_0560990 [Cryptomeria japonica]
METAEKNGANVHAGCCFDVDNIFDQVGVQKVEIRKRLSKFLEVVQGVKEQKDIGVLMKEKREERDTKEGMLFKHFRDQVEELQGRTEMEDGWKW